MTNEEAIKILEEVAVIDDSMYAYNEAYNKALSMAIEALKAQLPSAEPEIIRCKDCEYFHKSFCEIWSKFGTIQTRENGYCYMAERRTND